MLDPAVHVRSVGLDDTDDDVIFPWAERESRVVITADADFGEMLALGGATYAFAPTDPAWRVTPEPPLLDGHGGVVGGALQIE